MNQNGKEIEPSKVGSSGMLGGLNRGLPKAADMVASGPAPLRGLADEHTRNSLRVPWSLPSRGITGDLGGLRFNTPNSSR